MAVTLVSKHAKLLQHWCSSLTDFDFLGPSQPHRKTRKKNPESQKYPQRVIESYRDLKKAGLYHPAVCAQPQWPQHALKSLTKHYNLLAAFVVQVSADGGSFSCLLVSTISCVTRMVTVQNTRQSAPRIKGSIQYLRIEARALIIRYFKFSSIITFSEAN